MEVYVGIKCSGSKISNEKRATYLVPYTHNLRDLVGNLEVFTRGPNW